MRIFVGYAHGVLNWFGKAEKSMEALNLASLGVD